MGGTNPWAVCVEEDGQALAACMRLLSLCSCLGEMRLAVLSLSHLPFCDGLQPDVVSYSKPFCPEVDICQVFYRSSRHGNGLFHVV